MNKNFLFMAIILLLVSCSGKPQPADRYLNFQSGGLAFQAQYTWPKGTKSRKPAFLIVDGPGREDMDRSTYAFRKTIRPFRDLARRLARSGSAVLRFDKRTFLKKRSPVDFRKMSEDASYAYNLLKKQQETDPNRIYLIAFGSGSILVPKLAASCRFKKIFLINPVLGRIDRHLLFKLHYQLDFYKRHRLRSRLKPLIHRTGLLLAEARLAMEQLRNPDIPAGKQLLGYRKKFWKAWLAASLDLPDRLAGTGVPLTILQGSRNLQSPTGLVRQHVARMRRNGKKVDIHILRGMRHDMFHNPTGSFMTPMVKIILKNI